MKIAVVGTGVAGLGAAWMLSPGHEVVVYEKERRLGGHSHTHSIDIDGATVPVDTGFIVYNEPNYPDLSALLAHLDVVTRWSDMSFGVSLDGGRYEYGSGWLSFLGQRRNIVDPRHWRLVRDIQRFNREAPALIEDASNAGLPLREYLAAAGYGGDFARRYLLPMASAIWSAPISAMLEYPAGSLVRFFVNHGLLRVAGQLRWRSIDGGSQRYVEKIAARLGNSVRLSTAATRIERGPAGTTIRDQHGHPDTFDRVIVATHADQALASLADPTPRERSVLGAFRYTPNTAVLHADPSLMPRRRRVWSSWNHVAREGDTGAPASLTYWMNRLQRLPTRRDVFVSLNPDRPPAEESTWATMQYEHPLFDGAAVAAQGALAGLQGVRGTFFCGSYFGYGFHEDALSSGLDVAESMGAKRPWSTPARARRADAIATPGATLPGFGASTPVAARVSAE